MTLYAPSRSPSVGVLAFTAGVTAFLAAFLIFPLLHVVREAFWIEGRFTLAYFRNIFVENPVLRAGVANSLIIAGCATVCTSLIAVPLALVTTRCRFPGQTWLAPLLLAPMIMPPFVGAVGIRRILARGGSLNVLLTDRLGLFDAGVDFLGDGGYAAIIAMQALHLYPILYLNVSAALANIDPSLEEAARNLGDSGFRLFRKITFPLMLPGYFAGAVLVFIWSFTDLGTPLIFGLRRVAPVQIYDNLQDIHVNHVAYALVVVVAAVAGTLFLLGRLAVGRRGYEMLAKGTVAARERRLGRLAGGGVVLAVVALIAAGLLPHISVLLTSVAGAWSDTVLPTAYTTRYYAEAVRHDLAVLGVKNSLLLSFGSTLLDVVLGVGIAYVLIRKRFTGAGLLDALAMLPLALPGIVVAFGYATSFRGTWLDARTNPFPLLMIAYAVRRLPYMVRAAAAGFQQTSPAFEEAAMNVGASPLRALLTITTPLILANLIAGAVLSFSFAMLEVSDSLVLAFKQEHIPLAKAIYQLVSLPGEGPFIASALGIVAMALLTATLLAAATLLGKRTGMLFRV